MFLKILFFAISISSAISRSHSGASGSSGNKKFVINDLDYGNALSEVAKVLQQLRTYNNINDNNNAVNNNDDDEVNSNNNDNIKCDLAEIDLKLFEDLAIKLSANGDSKVS